MAQVMTNYRVLIDEDSHELVITTGDTVGPNKSFKNHGPVLHPSVIHDTALASPRGAGTVTPAVGDLIMELDYTSGTVDFALGLGYAGVNSDGEET